MAKNPKKRDCPALGKIITRNIYFAKREDGRTVAQAYLEEEGGKLKNDMRILLRSRQGARVALQEVRGVVDDGDPDEAEESQGFRRCWDWFEPEGEAHPMFGADARVLMGRVLLGNEGNWRLQTFGEAKYNSLKALFEKCMDGKVAFKTERKDNIAAKTLGDHSPLSEESLKRIPPELLEDLPDFDMSQSRIPVDREDDQPLSMVQMRERQLKSWIDEPLPRLDGATPREASRDPGKRAELIRLVKPMIRNLDQDALKNGEVADVDWIYDELDLDEIRAAAPPLRERQDKQTFEGPSLNRQVLAPIPAREITYIDEIYDIEDRVIELLESKDPNEADSIMTENCFTVMEALRDLVAGDDEEAIEDSMDLTQLMTPLVIMLLGTSELFEIDLDPGELEAEFNSQIQSMLAAVATETPEGEGNPLDGWFAACRQPLLLRVMLMRVRGFQEEKPGSFDENAFVPMESALCYAAALINLLCAKLDRVPR